MSTLISAALLLERLGDPSLRLADVRWYLGDPQRGRREYEAGHLPGAIFLDLEHDLRAPDGPGRHPLPGPADLAARLSALGIGDGHHVVAYDDLSGMVCGRLWWMLDSLGHRRVSILDGGLRAWRELGGPMTTEVPNHPPARLTLAPAWRNTIDRAELQARLGEVALVDLRAGERYRGEVEPIDPVAGHIPTATSLPAGRLLAEDGRLLEPEALARRLTEAGLVDRPAVVSCGSGVTACLAIVAARVAGVREPLLYPGSFSDWSTAGLPVATGPEPGD